MKIVQVVNAMISHADEITNVLRNNKEYFFLYKKKYKWSIISTDSSEYLLHLYPSEKISIEELAQVHNNDWEHYNYVTYKTSEIQEAEESFSELYRIVVDKLTGIDQILDDILSDF